jgi:hypothetical protein
MKKLILLIIVLSIFNGARAQLSPSLTSKIDYTTQQLPIEKLYLSFDKPSYSAGDTLWLKSVLLNADYSASTRTDKIYIELYNDSLSLIENRTIALNNGLGYGDIALSKKLAEGTYTIRAYSNWQQNFGYDYFFQKSFYIGNAGEKTWLLNSFQEINSTVDNKTLDLKLRITNLKNEAIGLKDIEVYLMNGSRRIAKADLQTKLDGTLDTKIPIGENKINQSFNIIIIDKKNKSQKSILPVKLLKQENLDLQFMPEGGHMVNGVFGKIAFKVIGNDGLGKELSGKIINSKAEVVTEFSTTHKGMGSFYLLPQFGESYVATFVLGGKEQKVPLPAVKQEGTTLRIDALSKPDSIYVYLKASEEKRLESYQLLAQKSNETIVSAPINLKNGISVLKIAKQVFPDGIIHFTLFSPQQQPVNERQVFINHKQAIKLEIKADKNNYQLRDSISIDITAINEHGLPLSGTFALAITDDGQVKQEDGENIISYFLAQSDLKGKIEDASFYFKDKEPSTLLAMDHLLLTQGWVGYKWSEIMLQNTAAIFKPESGNVVTGKVTGLFNKPVKDINVNLLSLGKEIFAIDTLTDVNGNFSFKNLPLTDSAAYNIKIKNVKGKTATGNITVEEFKRSALPLQFTPIKPWYVNTDSTLLNYFKLAESQIKIKERQEMVRTGTLLNEVVIKGQLRKKEIISKDAWDANFVMTISEEELKKNPQKMLRDLLKEKIPNFNVGSYWADICGTRPSQHSFSSFRIGGSLISHVLIDKVNTHLAASSMQDNYQQSAISLTADKEYGPMVYQTNTYIFNTLSASEITNITFYKGCNYYFLDITTRGGQGPWIAPTPGRYVYRPLPTYIAKDFYSPKYTVKDNSIQDFRSTIFWDANVVTDENGKAKISFYSADKPSTYTVKVEGTDLMGRFGFQKSSIKIVNKTDSK